MYSPPSPAKQMVYLYPRFYNCSVPVAFSADLPQLAQLCEGSKPAPASDKRVEQLLTIHGDKFVSFVKSERFVDGKIFFMHCRSFVFSLCRHLVALLVLLKIYMIEILWKTKAHFLLFYGRRWNDTTHVVTIFWNIYSYTKQCNQNWIWKLCTTSQKHLFPVVLAHFKCHSHSDQIYTLSSSNSEVYEHIRPKAFKIPLCS